MAVPNFQATNGGVFSLPAGKKECMRRCAKNDDLRVSRKLFQLKSLTTGCNRVLKGRNSAARLSLAQKLAFLKYESCSKCLPRKGVSHKPAATENIIRHVKLQEVHKIITSPGRWRFCRSHESFRALGLKPSIRKVRAAQSNNLKFYYI